MLKLASFLLVHHFFSNFAVLRDANKERMDWLVEHYVSSVHNPEETSNNVYIVDAPAFVPLVTLTKRYTNVAESNDHQVMQLCCYPIPSPRLPDAIYVHDWLQTMGIPRGGTLPLPLGNIDVDSLE
jgi:hypothetical protein